MQTQQLQSTQWNWKGLSALELAYVPLANWYVESQSGNNPNVMWTQMSVFRKTLRTVDDPLNRTRT